MACEASITTDRMFGGLVRLKQPEKGYRAGFDAVLLASAVPDLNGGLLDLGCGAGAVMLGAARRCPGLRMRGVEQDEHALALCADNIRENQMSQRIETVRGDAFALDPALQNTFDLVVSNPPFFEPGTISTPGPGREAAWLAEHGLKRWLNAMLFACRPKGRILLVHRAAELARILSVLERQAGEIAVLPVSPKPGRPAHRVLMTARKGLRPGPLTLLPTQYAFDGHGAESGWAAAIARGKPLDWPLNSL